MSAATLTERLGCLVDLDDAAVERGRYVTTRMLVDNLQELARVSIVDGRVPAVEDGLARPMMGWQFALRAPAAEWDAFWQPEPRPGFHDLFALLRRKQLRAEGDLHPFMSNLFYFKQLLALPRTSR